MDLEERKVYNDGSSSSTESNTGLNSSYNNEGTSTGEAAPGRMQSNEESYENSYLRRPIYTNKGYDKKRNSKKVVALAVLIVVCMIMSSIATSFALAYMYENGIIFGKEVNAPSDPSQSKEPTTNGVDGNVVIIKGNSDKGNIAEGSIGTPNMSVAQIASLVADSVVEITTSSVIYDAFYGQQVVSGAGSGVIIGRGETDTELYYVVTNNHVVEGAETIYLTLRNGKEISCRLIGSDVISDIAVLEIASEEELNVAHLGNSGNLLVGEEVVVIGNPLGNLGGTVTNGIISALERKVKVDNLDMTLLQTNAAISPGNSGGGMFNTAGELVGIINAKSSAESAEGLGFAIPVNYAYEIIEDILNYGHVKGRAALPFSVKEYSSTSVLGSMSNIVIITSESGNNEIQFNDVLYSVEGTKITTINGLRSVLIGYDIGEEVDIQVARTVGREIKLYNYTVTLVESTE